MLPNVCRFCEHGNPEGAKFCSECGGCLHLLPCPSCGAVTDVSTTTCYQCHTPLPWHNAGAVTAPATVVEVAKPALRWQKPVMAGAAVLAVVAALGYYGYRQRSVIDVSTPAAAGGVPRAGSVPADTPQAKAALVPAVAGAAQKAGGVGERVPPAGCTAEAAALGTCVPQSKLPKAEQPIRDTRSPPADTGKSAVAQPPRADGCAEAVAALGLCAALPPPTVTHTKRSE